MTAAAAAAVFVAVVQPPPLLPCWRHGPALQSTAASRSSTARRGRAVVIAAFLLSQSCLPASSLLYYSGSHSSCCLSKQAFRSVLLTQCKRWNNRTTHEKPSWQHQSHHCPLCIFRIFGLTDSIRLCMEFKAFLNKLCVHYCLLLCVSRVSVLRDNVGVPSKTFLPLRAKLKDTITVEILLKNHVGSYIRTNRLTIHLQPPSLFSALLIMCSPSPCNETLWSRVDCKNQQGANYFRRCLVITPSRRRSVIDSTETSLLLQRRRSPGRGTSFPCGSGRHNRRAIPTTKTTFGP